MKFTFSLSTLALILNIFLGFLLIFFERHNPTVTLAWLMVLVILPIVGFVLYLLLGQNLNRKKIFDVKAEEDIFNKKLLKQNKSLPGNIPLNNMDEINEYLDMIYMNYNNSHALCTQNNKVDIYTNGIDKFNALFKSIENADTFIHMVYYQIKSDSLGTKLIELLTKKAQEGVEVKFLYDAMGGRTLSRHFFDKLIKSGGQVSCFFPSLLPHINIRINYRNHRKLAIIDGQSGFIGGFNIADQYIDKNKRFGFWRDTHLKIQGNAVNDMEERFLLDWSYAAKEKLVFEEKYFPIKKVTGTTAIQIISSGPDSTHQQIKNGYLKMIYSAKKNIYIETPYFIPDESILEALRVAALSGVDVRIIIPNKPDHPFVHWATCCYVGELLKYGVKSYKYENGFIHSKSIVVDGKVSSVGTANMDIRSYKLNFEVNAFLYNKETAKKLQNIFKEDIKQSTEITKELYESRSLFTRFRESISRLLSPLL